MISLNYPCSHVNKCQQYFTHGRDAFDLVNVLKVKILHIVEKQLCQLFIF